MKFIPFGSKVLIKPEVLAQKTASGLFISQAHGQAPNQGEVIAVGGAVNPEVATGDTVVYSRYEGVKIAVDGVEFLCVTSSALHGKLVP
jgi:chaperonin GroES